MDFAEVTLAGAQGHPRRTSAEQASIDAAVDECGGPVDALLSCAGVADGTPGIERINFIGHRHLIDRMLAKGMLPIAARRSASSPRPPASAGRRACPSSTSCSTRPTSTRPSRGSQDHGEADYCTSKQAICAYVARPGVPDAEAGASASTPSAPARPTRRWRRPTRRCGSASAPTSAARSASRRRPRSSRRTRSCSSAATPPLAINGITHDHRTPATSARASPMRSRPRPSSPTCSSAGSRRARAFSRPA